MLDRIEDMLIELNINYTRLDGTMTREQRAQAMDDLRTKKSVEVMLVSTRAGGVGLNLTSACRAYLVDPYWNPSVEAQAIDRVHRMGQKMPVTAVRLMIKNSVEEKLHKIQVKKASLANLSLKKMSRKELMEQKVGSTRLLLSLTLSGRGPRRPLQLVALLIISTSPPLALDCAYDFRHLISPPLSFICISSASPSNSNTISPMFKYHT
jgi:superfamily II DNA or RNA helicase